MNEEDRLNESIVDRVSYGLVEKSINDTVGLLPIPINRSINQPIDRWSISIALCWEWRRHNVHSR